MTLTIELTPELEAKLRERAAAEGKEPAAFALEAVREKLAPPAGRVTTEKRLAGWNRFPAGVREHAGTLPPGHFVDDSRESIYQGRGE